MAKTAKQLEVKTRHIYKPEIETCPHCGEPLRARSYYQWRKTVQQLSGAVYVASEAQECVNPGCPHQGQAYTSAAAQMVTVSGCTYGLDIIAQIGWWRDQEHLNREQIHGRLGEREVQICERQVDHLYARYQVLMASAERLERDKLEQVVAERGGLIIGLDGLESEGASEQLWVVREVQSERNLVVGWLPRANHQTLKTLLTPVAELELPVLATLSDKQGCVRKALEETWPEVPHQWCQSHYLSQVTRPIYDRDRALKTDLRQTIRQAVRKSMKEVLSRLESPAFSPQLVTGMLVVANPAEEATKQPPTRQQVVQDLALDLQQALSRTGRAPLVLSGLPLFEDLCALQETLAQCLALGDDPRLRHWHQVLSETLPTYQQPFTEVQQALDWVKGIETLLRAPLPTEEDAGPGGDAVARQLAHYLGTLADRSDLTPWLGAFRGDLFAISERYWSGLFHCYDIVGLPRTNNDHEGLYGQLKRCLRRQRGVEDLHDSLRRHGAWMIFQNHAASPEALRERLAQVPWEVYLAERARYDRRQALFRRRYQWRHRREVVRQQRVAAWTEAVSDC